MERTSDEFRENNGKVFPIKALLSRFYGNNKRYFYLSGPNLDIPNNVDKNISTEDFFEFITKHMKGEIRLGASCELKINDSLILSSGKPFKAIKDIKKNITLLYVLKLGLNLLSLLNLLYQIMTLNFFK